MANRFYGKIVKTCSPFKNIDIYTPQFKQVQLYIPDQPETLPVTESGDGPENGFNREKKP
jgi:hypothetical protein